MMSLIPKIKLLSASLVLLTLAVSFAFPITAKADIASNVQDVCSGVSSSAGSCSNGSSASSVSNLVHLIITIFSVVVGVVSVFMIIVGGLKFTTSGGEASKVSSAKSTITYAIIGLVVAALAELLVRFVLHRASNP